MKTVGIIGLGLLGTALADRLLSRGWFVTGFDVDADRRDHLIESGGVAVNVLSEIASFDFILLSLPTSQVVAEVVSLLKPELRSGQTIVDTTTGNPDDVESIAAELAELKIDYLDATVGGSSQQARAGEAVIMCGGSEDAVARCSQLFDDLAVRTFYLGPTGNGSRMKLAVNLVLGLNRAVLAEGLSFAERLGLDPAITLEVLKSGPAWSRAMDTKGEKMLQSDFSPQARLAQHLKDVRVILEAGKGSHAKLPLSQVHLTLLSELVESGHGDGDNSAIIAAFRDA
ncbi:MAG: NAD(P)-dependent oxidoreductase [Planctomycetota bacterium]|nr:NAD(P)-dependent oxidoreductase [Planctomycetota bacterium]